MGSVMEKAHAVVGRVQWASTATCAKPASSATVASLYVTRTRVWDEDDAQKKEVVSAKINSKERGVSNALWDYLAPPATLCAMRRHARGREADVQMTGPANAGSVTKG